MPQRSCHPAFEARRQHSINSLGLTVEEYRHRKTGAQHFHLAANNNENVFLVGLRTVPQDSTGVAHILEHTVLCGSERFPLRDPFFMMIRRSLNTFMNAFTSSDWTAYPFASQNRKDFDNLLQVYLDAVFFSRLDPLDFAQEGHRLEFADPGNPESPLVHKGVVYNEMKGAMSSVPSQLWHTLCKYLFPTTTYHYNSGGDPESIPDLDYNQLQAFYQRHYHPSNAVFMTYGDIPAEEHHAKFEALALSRFEASPQPVLIPDEKRYHAPLRVVEHYPVAADDSTEDKTHIVMGWLLDKSTDPEAWLEAQFLTNVLLDNSASPLQKALETSNLGSSPSPLCGLEDGTREMSFVCGLEGSDARHIEAVETHILETLQAIARDGVPREELESVLHQLELHQREVGGDSYPYGLQLIMSALSCATHGGDPVAMLDIEPALEQLRKHIENPDYIKQLVAKLLLDNRHRVTLVMTPDTELAERREQAEAHKLEAIKSSLDDSARKRIVELSEALLQRQQLKEDESILPKVGLEDISPEIAQIHPLKGNGSNLPITCYDRGTNGLLYQQLLFRLPALTAEDISLLPCYSTIITEVGVGERDYLSTQALQASVCGGFSAFTSLRAQPDDEQRAEAYLVLSSKALTRSASQLQHLMRDTVEKARFDESGRIRELIAQQRARRDMSITGSGHALAMSAACSKMSPVAEISHQLSGLEGIHRLRALDDSLEDKSAIEVISNQLTALHNRISASARQMLLIAEGSQLPTLERDISAYWQDFHAGETTHALSLPPVRETVRQLWVTNTQVNFCAKAYPTVPMNHPDAPALAVLGGFLRNGYLHRAIREQGGAYGGGASQDANIAAFRFYSYRDPRLAETLEDFDEAVQWLLREKHDAEQLEQAILGVISGIDKPGSPAGDARQDFHNRLFGRTPENRQAFRQGVLKVTLEDLRRVADCYLRSDQASIAVITHAAGRDSNAALIEKMGLDTLKL